MPRCRIAVLGAGPAGLGAARQLARQGKARPVVLEERPAVGGNAGSFLLAGIPVDYGSHRLHPACDPRILEDLRSLLGPALLERPRHGRIRLHGRWIHFPLKPLDLVRNLPWSFRLGVARDALRKLLAAGRDAEPATFATVLERGLGRTICRDFYFPYARKIWGLDPGELSPTGARRRVSAGSLAKLARRVLRLGGGGARKVFFYPRGGYGRISEAIAEAARQAGTEIRLETRVTAVHLGPPHRVAFAGPSGPGVVEVDLVWSTLPLALFARLVSPPPPPPVLEAAGQLESRAMILVYLILDRGRFSDYDAHYFPQEDVVLSRLSEPKNYGALEEPRDTTVLCAEVPCARGGVLWEKSDAELGELVASDLARCDLSLGRGPSGVATRRLAHAYPVYRRGYEEAFAAVDGWAADLPGILSFGRQGLFAHDNTHHALAMAYAAAECLDGGRFDGDRWRAYRREFEGHVVED